MTDTPKYGQIMPCTEEGCTATYAFNKRRKTTLCARHAKIVSDRCPKRRAKLSANLKQRHADPSYAARHAKLLKKARARMEAEGHPVIAKYSEALRKHRINPSVAGTEERRLACAKGVATRLAHIPLEYRDDYLALGKSQRIRAEERTKLILEMADADAAFYHRTGRMRQSERKKL